ncbi:UvrD-helicase domain-containing protein [Dongia sp. agr-C8]
MITETANNNFATDDHVDKEIAGYLDPKKPRSFFLYAGAGSGKTKTLVQALNHVRANQADHFRLRGQRIGVITYTNAAADEIQRRIASNPLFNVSTIHSFAWELINGLTHDIREALREILRARIEKLNEEEKKGRGGKASIARQAKIASSSKRLARLSSIKKFAYSPTGENREPNSLNHHEVISICANFISSKPLMQSILIGRFPLLLIDESQDTNKDLVDALLATARLHEGRFCLGLIGDVMQRIYQDGKDNIEKDIPDTWATPIKKLNHRCPNRVIQLINKIRSDADARDQAPRSDAIDGTVRLFLRPNSADRQATEESVRGLMADITKDEDWRTRDRCKILTLEHHMAAKRLGFEAVLTPLMLVDSWRTGVIEGTLPAVSFFSEVILPLVEAEQHDDKFAVARIVLKRSPLVSPDVLKATPEGEALKKARDAVAALMLLWNDRVPSCGEVLDSISATGLFEIPDVWQPLVALRSSSVSEQADDEVHDPLPERLRALEGLLEAPFDQIPIYKHYVSGAASFDTHQGVKGLEFDRVLVVIDKEEERGFMFSYNKLFGVEPLSARDTELAGEGKDNSIDRTRRLLYVTCSRAKKSLALIMYTDQPLAAKMHVVSKGWFSEQEVDGA